MKRGESERCIEVFDVDRRANCRSCPSVGVEGSSHRGAPVSKIAPYNRNPLRQERFVLSALPLPRQRVRCVPGMFNSSELKVLDSTELKVLDST
jgi:hypothetical protein